MRYFNTEGLCNPKIHYMVNLDKRLRLIKERYVERGSYFIINRGRQYGKTTTLRMLEGYLKDEYLVLSLDFQELTTTNFQSESSFVEGFKRCLWNAMEMCGNEVIPLELRERCHTLLAERTDMSNMFQRLSQICEISPRPIVLMIDEVDSASNNQVFIDFLALLRRYYLGREKRATFQSVILAGVYDIKNLKLKIRPEAEHQYNSPWNIAAKFSVDMDFGANQIADMLREYETDHHTGMDVESVAKCIYDYTSGYPYLVSAICKILDEELLENEEFENLSAAWTETGIVEAVKILLKEKVTLFDNMVKQLDTYRELREMIKEIIYQGRRISYSPDVKSIEIGLMFGFLKGEEGQIVVANRIFEMRLLNMYIAEEAARSEVYQSGECDKNQFISNKMLDMDLVLRKFVEYFTDIYGDNDEKFVETYGRKFFLLYLKPIINGTGNYYLEAQTRDASRTDVIVDYLGQQFVVELKIWRGNEYNERGERQLSEYLDYYHLDKGYLLSFNFNKKKEVGIKELRIGDKVIVEAVV